MRRIFMLWAVTWLAAVSAIQAEEFTATTSNSAVLERLNSLEAELAALRNAQVPSSSDGGSLVQYSASGTYFGGAELTFLAPQASTLAVAATPLPASVSSLSSSPTVASALEPLAIEGVAIQLTPKFTTFAAGRFWAGYRNSQGLGMRIRYWDYAAQATGTFNDVPIDTTVNALAIDAEATHLFDFGAFELDCSAGLRWGQFRRDTIIDGLLMGQDFGGLGLTAALAGRRTLGSSAFALVGGGRASFLFGDNDYVLEIPIDDDAPFQIGLVAQHAPVMVYEMQAGLEWSQVSASGFLYFARVQAEAQMWIIPSAAFGLLDSTTGLVGVSTAVGVNW